MSCRKTTDTMSMSSEAAAQHHEQNVETIVRAAAQVVPPPPALNPLLARGKLKKSNSSQNTNKKNKNKNKSTTAAGRTELIKDVYQAKQDELGVVSAGAGAAAVDPHEESEVLDLADQLLQQLGDQVDDDDGTSTEVGGSTRAVGTHTPSGAMSPAPSTTSSHASHGSSARERLHDLKEDIKGAFLPNRKADHQSSASPLMAGVSDGGEKKMGRQEARKVSSRVSERGRAYRLAGKVPRQTTASH